MSDLTVFRSQDLIDSPRSWGFFDVVNTYLTEPNQANAALVEKAMKTAIHQVGRYSDQAIFTILTALAITMNAECIRNLENLALGIGRRKSTGELAPRMAQTAVGIMNQSLQDQAA